MSIRKRPFRRRRLRVRHFYRRKISALFTEGYANAVFEIFPEVNNRLREPCQLQHAFGTRWNAEWRDIRNRHAQET